jgi:hypothetical protein
MTFKEETLQIAEKRAEDIKKQFISEVNRLLRSGAIDSKNHNRGILFRVALENIANGFNLGNSPEYKNLKYF